MPDDRLYGGRYELGEELGFGGMAEVFRARDTRLGRDVAVKVLRADLARDPAFLQRFQREAQAAANLNHANIVGVYDTGEQDGVPYIVMELVTGRTLRDVIANDGRLLPRRALEIVGEICAALDYSHRQGIVHRDIKPANVMLTPSGDVKVMDFGIARAASAASATMTQTAQILGTAQYLSPEQARGEHVDGRSDIYSTGCLLYELLTGVPPFQGESAVAVAYQHVREDPLPPSQIDPDLPPSLDAVVLKAMAKNPANRYQSAGEFKTDVDRAAAGRKVEATPVLSGAPTTVIPQASPTTVLLRPGEDDRSRRRRTAYVALAIAVLVVFVAIALLVKSLFHDTTTSISVPNVVGQTQQAAINNLTAAGLAPKVVAQTPQGQDGNSQPAGKVYAQSPVNGFTVKKGTEVDLKVSTGVRHVQIPDVIGQQQSAATAALQGLGLIVNTNTKDVPGTAGTVLDVNPKPGVTVDAGTQVTLTVVSGQQQVPNVLNQPYAQAAQTLQQTGFQVQRVDVPNAAPPGTVIDESPSGGTTQNTNSTITLKVSSGPATSSPPPTTSSPPATTSSAAPTTSSPPPSAGASSKATP
ncbi:MAG TPA: Stk1 family PASTA domain-containing Ser/Thr kinase [Mycobacteriales bacterium]